MNKIMLIIRKELFRVFGDRKLIISLYVLPAVICFVIYGLMGKMIGAMEKDITSHTSVITVVNASDDLKKIFDSTGFSANADITYIDAAEYSSDKANIDENIKNGDVDMCIRLDDDFAKTAEDYINGGSTMPSMDVYYNDTENYSQQAYEVFMTVVSQNYKSQLLAERFGDLELLNAFDINTESICKEEKSNTMFARMLLPYMVVMLLFSGVMSVGVDAIAGEKERGTLSSMLISPVKRSEIAIGKMVSMAILSGISAIVTTVAMILAFSFMGNQMSAVTGAAEGMKGLSISPVQALELLGIMIALVLFYVGVIALVAVYSTNTKTASSVISPLYIVIILMGMATMFRTGSDTPTPLYLVPVYGNALAISDICSNELTAVNFLASFCATLLFGAIMTVLVTRAFNNEKLMFNA